MASIKQQICLITGTSRGIGRYLVEYYTQKGYHVIGCSRQPVDFDMSNYEHFCVNVTKERQIKEMVTEIRKSHHRLDILINNAGIASMNHSLLTPIKTVQDILDTNFVGTFLFSREAVKWMQKRRYGRIINFATVATPLKLEGEAVYAASKAAVITLTQILAKELGDFGITVNAVGPTPIKTDLIRSVPQDKIDDLISRQAIHRFGEFRDITNIIDFFIKPESDFVTGQVIYLGGA
jgi:3-oxoacyl-[acyl-carrier protein] reductase